MPASREAEAERDTPSRSQVVAATATATRTSRRTSSRQASLFMPASRDAKAERDPPSGAKPNPPRPKKQRSASQIAATANMGRKQKAALLQAIMDGTKEGI